MDKQHPYTLWANSDKSKECILWVNLTYVRLVFVTRRDFLLQAIGAQYYRRFLAKYAKSRQQIWADWQGINPRDKNQKQANFCSQVVGQFRTPYSIKALCIKD